MRPSNALASAILAGSLLTVAGEAGAADGFDVVTLGALGGIEDGNLSAHLIRPHDDGRSVTCDAGTLVNGLKVADEKGSLDDVRLPDGTTLSRVGYTLTDRIKGYLVSHAHLDHVAGLVVASPDDSSKPIYALASVNAALVDSYFNWQAWPNFTNRGKAPQLKKFVLNDLRPTEALPLLNTKMTVTAFPLSHAGIESTAFLIEGDGDSVLCFGDTGPDGVEKSTKMHDVWAAVAERARQHRLKAILIESSYPSDRADAQLFGHLTPKYVLQGLHELDRLSGSTGALKGLPVIVTHIKYSLTREQPQRQIRAELDAGNDLGVRFLLPEQGSHWHFR